MSCKHSVVFAGLCATCGASVEALEAEGTKLRGMEKFNALNKQALSLTADVARACGSTPSCRGGSCQSLLCRTRRGLKERY
jgi:hypothetical protein